MEVAPRRPRTLRSKRVSFSQHKHSLGDLSSKTKSEVHAVGLSRDSGMTDSSVNMLTEVEVHQNASAIKKKKLQHRGRFLTFAKS